MDNVLVVSYPYERILVAILASALAVFLVLAIIIAVKAIKLMNRLNGLVEKAEEVVDRVEEVGESVRKAAGSLAIGNTVAKISEAFLKRGNKRNKGDDDA